MHLRQLLAAALRFLPRSLRSRAREKRLRVLQREIAYEDRPADEPFSRNMGSILAKDSADLMTIYTRVCCEDERVSELMMDYGLRVDDLHGIYVRLKLAGLDQWIGGRHTALSSIAHAEPLEFVIESQRRQISPVATSLTLIEYWEGRIRKGRLLDYLGK